MILKALRGFGREWQSDRFYANKYFNAFPDLLHGPEPLYGNKMDNCENCYSYRVFEVFMRYLGLVNLKHEGESWRKNLFVSKTDLFDKLIKVEAPRQE